jgi:hypothetical protein
MASMERLLAALQKLGLDPATAETERVAPLLYFASPEEASPVLRRAYYESAARNVLLLDALDELTRVFASRGLRPVFVKGADFARNLYSSPALRPMGDLDVWVAPEELAEPKASCVPGLSARHSGDVERAQPRRPPRALYVAGVRGDIALDLHWSLVGHATDRRVPSLEWFRRRTAGDRLDATASLLYLAAHMKLQHYDERPPLIWLADFYLLSQKSEIDWPALFDAATAFRWEAALAATAAEVEARLGLELPAPLKAHARTSTMPIPERKGGPEHAWSELRALPFVGRVALARAILLPTPSYVRFRYRPRPSWTWPLFYPVRWAHIVQGALSLAVKGHRTRPVLGEIP